VDRREILAWLRETDPARLAELYAAADGTRREQVGDAVHLRGLIEISNCCVRECGYCGLRAPNRTIRRYRMRDDEILDCARAAAALGYGTVVLQSGEDEGIRGAWMAALIRGIKREAGVAVTLSLGERTDAELRLWRAAGADRYLLRFETSDRELYDFIHPPRPGRISDRIALLGRIAALGYEAGSGIMIGIPGQTYESVARDIETFRALDLDMIGVGPYIAHPQTPLGNGEWRRRVPDQIPAAEEMVYKVVALARLACPQANIPATTALATINTRNGRELGLMRGANVVMPNMTPPEYRRYYEIYPNKACIAEKPSDCATCLRGRIRSIGRTVGSGHGGRARACA
jgi:biotin synthase